MPTYSLSRAIQNVPDAWPEYAKGYAGGPPVKEMEERFGAKWRKEPRDTQLFRRRNAIYTAIATLKASKRSVETAVQALEGRRVSEKGSLDMLQKILLADRN
ncbi:hypothetical protein M427DRAFT_488822 [Gonapodya prolifera JEL478]|uniref:Transcription activator GCR1-like domain-containing protein n=1 Tax=Gonapodya prolifera (strain JEL478) TaxID=1344416 RepID=A0A138ZZD3_GONPJ|nr:hypothetical protein M427DRAFT_488822 [Gonapodya prolifera JEL478]|eukprot:KXS09851.1 hypothetical protein M427DRAFT_488822 [Gonapodya prolifera JEL478]